MKKSKRAIVFTAVLLLMAVSTIGVSAASDEHWIHYHKKLSGGKQEVYSKYINYGHNWYNASAYDGNGHVKVDVKKLSSGTYAVAKIGGKYSKYAYASKKAWD
ncbi:MAG: hypothetical protein K2J67_08270 [Lachnospiraceae bacterium]|nr:hypothetical protein [Lachnospiraceae bacterium]